MSTYSPSLKLTLIADGDQAGTWGQTTNINLGTLLEQAITGVVSIVHPDTATYTLSNLNGVSDEARNAVLVISGTLSAQRDVIAPAVEKTYTIRNATTGGYAIRIKTSGGAAITIPNGITLGVYCDGTDFFVQNNGTAGGWTVTGNASVGGTLNVTGTTTLSTALAITSGGTGSTTASGARTNLGLGTIATQNANSVTITGGSISGITDLAVADGGTGASDASGARTNLGLGTISTQDANNVSITGGSISGITDLAIADGGTGASDASGARTNLGLGTIATQAANNVSITGGSITGVTLASGNASFTGTPTAPTAALGTNTTQIATTAFVTAALQAAYPVGSIYMNATNSTNPATILGFGTWSSFGAGRMPVGFDAGNSNFNAAEKTGGSQDAIAVAHTHTFSATTSVNGSHVHDTYHSTTGEFDFSRAAEQAGGFGGDKATKTYNTNLMGNAGDHNHSVSGTTASTGSSGTNANLPPYITVFMWKRVS